MITLLSRQLIDVFPDVADRYLDFNTLEDQRPLRVWHINELRDKMEAGLFRYGNIAFCRIKDSGTDVMLDGQHVCHATTRYERPIQAVVERWQTSNELERSELFRQYEILSRGLPEMVKVEAGALKISWPAWISNLVVSAIAIDLQKRNTGNITHFRTATSPSKNDITISPIFNTKERKVAALRGYLREGTFICDTLTGDSSGKSVRKDVKHLARAPIAYAMMETWRKNETQARVFWAEVRDGEYLKKGSPTKALREFLIETTGRNIFKGTVRPNNHQYIYRSFVAWNAFIEGRNTALRYRPELQPPELMGYSNKKGGKRAHKSISI